MRKLTEEQKERNIIHAKQSFLHNQKRKKKLFKKPQSESVRLSIGVEKFCWHNHLSTASRKPQQSIKVDEGTNLFDNPEKLLKTLLELLSNAKQYKTVPNIIFKGRIRFATLYLIDNMNWEISRKRQWGFHFVEMDPEDQAIFTQLRSFYSSVYENEKVYMLNEKVHINRSDDQLANQQYKQRSKEITDMVIQGVRENSDPSFNLSPEQYQAISSTIGEHFDNILLHVPESEFGYLCGFYDKIGKMVHILIFNFGKTIYDSLSSAKLPPEIQAEIDSVVNSHTKNKFFDVFSSKFTKENAYTLLSLQEGISSRLEYDKSRGHGITDFIDHCFTVNQDTQIALISGSTAIKIDKKYHIEKKHFIDRKRRIIAFNDDCDLFQKPDSDYVINMNAFFPGLIIETRIPLNI